MFDTRVGNYVFSAVAILLIAVALLVNRNEFPPANELTRLVGHVIDVRSGGAGSGVIELASKTGTKHLKFAWGIRDVFSSVETGDELSLMLDGRWIVAATHEDAVLIDYAGYRFRRSRTCWIIVCFVGMVFMVNAVAMLLRECGVFGSHAVESC